MFSHPHPNSIYTMIEALCHRRFLCYPNPTLSEVHSIFVSVYSPIYPNFALYAMNKLEWPEYPSRTMDFGNVLATQWTLVMSWQNNGHGDDMAKQWHLAMSWKNNRLWKCSDRRMDFRNGVAEQWDLAMSWQNNEIWQCHSRTMRFGNV